MSFWDITLKLLTGFGGTCLIFLLTLVMALPLGLLIAFGSMTKIKPVRIVVRAFVWIIRGVPLMLQLFIVYYVPGFIFGTPITTRFAAAIIAFVINYACYFSEIYRGGIESINKGQYEAGKVLGMTRTQIFFRVILLQVIKRIVPPMSNEIITLVKDTALVRVISVVEIIWQAEELMASALIWPLFYAGVFYLVFVGILTLLFRYIEKKMSYFQS